MSNLGLLVWAKKDDEFVFVHALRVLGTDGCEWIVNAFTLIQVITDYDSFEGHGHHICITTQLEMK
jgi:hypothetical protein